MFTKYKVIICCVVAVLVLAAVFGVWYLFQPKTLINTDTLKVVRNGVKIMVCDIAGEKEYFFRLVRVKRSNGISESYTAVSTDTISIDILPHGKLKIVDKTAEKVYSIQRKFSG